MQGAKQVASLDENRIGVARWHRIAAGHGDLLVVHHDFAHAQPGTLPCAELAAKRHEYRANDFQ
jgi:hypothetical protein